MRRVGGPFIWDFVKSKKASTFAQTKWKSTHLRICIYIFIIVFISEFVKIFMPRPVVFKNIVIRTNKILASLLFWRSYLELITLLNERSIYKSYCKLFKIIGTYSDRIPQLKVYSLMPLDECLSIEIGTFGILPSA